MVFAAHAKQNSREQMFLGPHTVECVIFLQNDQLSYPIDDPEKLMDEVDTLVFDYLIQNLDRHVHTFEPALYSSLLILDNGKRFVYTRAGQKVLRYCITNIFE